MEIPHEYSIAAWKETDSAWNAWVRVKSETTKLTVKQEVFKVREYQHNNGKNEDPEERQNRPDGNTRKENLDEKKDGKGYRTKRG